MRPSARVLVVGAAAAVPLVFACAPAPAEDPAAAALHGESGAAGSTPLQAFVAEYDFLDEERWMHVDVKLSHVTNTRRRLHFEKSKVAAALLTHAGGEREEAAPMEYPFETAFVAQALGEDGEVLDTEVLITQAGARPRFFLFGPDGEHETVFHAPGDPPDAPSLGPVPGSCIGCHVGPDYFHPTMSYPQEPKDRAILMPEEWRDLQSTMHFLEGRHRGEFLFAPYGSLLIGKLRADAAAGTLSIDDEVLWEAIVAKYPQFDGPPSGRE